MTGGFLLGWWALICALLILYTVFLRLSFKRLRHSHADMWKKLGEPHVLGDFRTSYSARRFVWSEQCSDLKDRVLTQRVRFSYYSGMTAAVLGLVLVASLAVPTLLQCVGTVRLTPAGPGVAAIARSTIQVQRSAAVISANPAHERL